MIFRPEEFQYLAILTRLVKSKDKRNNFSPERKDLWLKWINDKFEGAN